MEPTDWVAVYAAGLSTILAILNWRRTRTRVSVDLEYDEPSGSFEVRVVNRSEHPIYVKAVAVDDARNSPPEWEWVGGQGPIEPHDWRYFGREWHFVGSITVRAWVRLGNDKVVSTEARTFE